MAKLDITERRLPQDGRIQVRYLDKSVDMRVSSLPAQHGEKITLRILDASQAVKALDRLGFGAPDLKILRDAAKKPQGMILITGPTGSGKTTTLYALLREIFSPKTNIVTIENPIEYQLKGINQVEVNEKQGLTFGGVLRSVLRQDPDVILLGELRDEESAQAALRAAESGHFVLSTMHTIDAAETIGRLVEFFPPGKHDMVRQVLAGVLRGVVSQRLLPRAGGGRVAAVEVMVNTARIADLIREGRSDEITEAIEDGDFHKMQSFSQHLVQLVLEGLVDEETAGNAATNRHDFEIAVQQALRRKSAAEKAAVEAEPAQPGEATEPEEGNEVRLRLASPDR
jgi:pilus retraction protein PilT